MDIRVYYLAVRKYLKALTLYAIRKWFLKIILQILQLELYY